MLSVNLVSNPLSVTPLNVDFNLTFAQGPVGLTGPSGCGKTTLLRTIVGLETHFDGKISFNDSLLFDCTNGEKTGLVIKPELRGIGLVFQHPVLFSHLNVLGNLQFALKRANQINSKKAVTVEQVVAWCGLEELLKHSTQQLSGGQKQRVALARAIIQQPKLLLLDEPFTGIDVTNRRLLIGALKEINQQLNMPMLMVSHDINDIRLLCPELMLMEQGKIVASGDTLKLLNQYQTGQLLEQHISATIKCEVIALESNEAQTTEVVSLDFEGHSIELCDNCPVVIGQQVMAVISADEVSVSLSRHEDSSIVNCLASELKELVLLPCGHQLLHLLIYNQQATSQSQDDGQVIFAKVTQKSVQRLNLRQSMLIYAQFKASAVKLLV